MVFIYYLTWHYITAPREILVLFKNFSIAVWHKFLILQHLKTLLSPWHRFRAKELFGAQNFGDKVGNWIFDLFTRFIAALIRLSVISAGLVAQLIVIMFFVILFAVWMLWPFVVIAFLGRGVTLILS